MCTRYSKAQPPTQVHVKQLFQWKPHQQKQGGHSRNQRQVFFFIVLILHQRFASAGLLHLPTPRQPALAGGTRSASARARTWRAWAATRAAAWWPPPPPPAGGATCPCPRMERRQHRGASHFTDNWACWIHLKIKHLPANLQPPSQNKFNAEYVHRDHFHALYLVKIIPQYQCGLMYGAPFERCCWHCVVKISCCFWN